MAGLADDASLAIAPPTAVWERFVLLSLPAAWHGLLSGKLSQFPLIRLQAPFFFNPVHFPDKRVHIQLASHTKFKKIFLAKALWYLTPHFTANQIGAMQLRCSTVSIETSSVMTGEKGVGVGGCRQPITACRMIETVMDAYCTEK